jgi:hypothetical protein
VTPGRAAAGERRAARLLRWYPAAWRTRYGAEFTELLLAEFADQPRSWRRAADVARSGLLARLTAAGLTSSCADPASQLRVSLVTTGCALGTFLTFGIAMLAQLATGWQWGTPPAAATSAGAIIMTLAAAGIGLVALLAAGPLAWLTAVTLIRGRARRCDPARRRDRAPADRRSARRDRRLAAAAGLLLAGASVLVTGARHFQNSWPGTGGTAGHHGLMPGGLAAFGWAATLSVSSYWAHPGELLRFPAAELAWMALSPAALACMVAGAAMIARRLPMPGRLMTYLTRLAAAAALGACCFFTGAACWVFSQESGRAGLFHAGALDVTGLAVMTLAVAVAVRAAVSARAAGGRLAGPQHGGAAG